MPEVRDHVRDGIIGLVADSRDDRNRACGDRSCDRSALKGIRSSYDPPPRRGSRRRLRMRSDHPDALDNSCNRALTLDLNARDNELCTG